MQVKCKSALLINNVDISRVSNFMVASDSEGRGFESLRAGQQAKPACKKRASLCEARFVLCPRFNLISLSSPLLTPAVRILRTAGSLFAETDGPCCRWSALFHRYATSSLDAIRVPGYFLFFRLLLALLSGILINAPPLYLMTPAVIYF